MGFMSMAKIETRDYLPLKKVSTILGLSADTLRQYIHNKNRNRTPCIEGFQVAPGSSWLIHKDEVKRYEKERKQRGRQSN